MKERKCCSICSKPEGDTVEILPCPESASNICVSCIVESAKQAIERRWFENITLGQIIGGNGEAIAHTTLLSFIEANCKVRPKPGSPLYCDCCGQTKNTVKIVRGLFADICENCIFDSVKTLSAKRMLSSMTIGQVLGKVGEAIAETPVSELFDTISKPVP